MDAGDERRDPRRRTAIVSVRRCFRPRPVGHAAVSIGRAVPSATDPPHRRTARKPIPAASAVGAGNLSPTSPNSPATHPTPPNNPPTTHPHTTAASHRRDSDRFPYAGPVKTLAAVLLRAGIPLVIMTAIGIALLAQGKAEDGRATLAVGVIAAAVSGASIVYQIDTWSMRKQTLVHFAIMTVTVLPALLLSGWFTLDSVWGYIGVIATFLGAGILLWVFFFVLFTRILPRRETPRSTP